MDVTRVSDRLGLGMLFRKIDAPYSTAGAGMVGLPTQVKASDPLSYSLDALGSFLGNVPQVPSTVPTGNETAPVVSSDAGGFASSVVGWVGNNLLAVIVGVLLLAIGLRTLTSE